MMDLTTLGTVICVAVPVGFGGFSLGVVVGSCGAWEEAEHRYRWNRPPFHNPRIGRGGGQTDER
jgi:hypothetical protein